jgi:acetyltransferase-like isoleucine patch superfamily enzyme
MKYLLFAVFKVNRKIYRTFFKHIDKLKLKFFLFIYDINHKEVTSNGHPFFNIGKNTFFSIGENFKMNNGLKYNTIGYSEPCSFVLSNEAKLSIGNHVGMSQSTIVCQQEIIIKNYVKLGGGVKIYDSDFHSLKAEERMDFKSDMLNKKTKKIVIGNHVFIGANSIILKGVEIGDNSIIGAGAVVSKSIPANQIWGGNPARFIKENR